MEKAIVKLAKLPFPTEKKKRGVTCKIKNDHFHSLRNGPIHPFSRILQDKEDNMGKTYSQFNMCFNPEKIISFNIYNVITVLRHVAHRIYFFFSGDILLPGFNFSKGKNPKTHLGYH